MSNLTDTVLEINLSALEHNFNYLKSRVTSGTKILAVVKAFSYGSDAITVARKLEKLGADYLGVAYVKEGVSLRKNLLRLPILVMHPQEENFETLIENALEPAIFNLHSLSAFLKTATSIGVTEYPVHLNFNTGLNRLGFKEQDIPQILSLLNQTSVLKVVGVYSHLAASEDLEKTAFTEQQILIFNKISNTLCKKLKSSFIKHLCNTSGLLNFPEAHFDMVRCGIGLFGYGNSIKESKKLLPIACLRSKISHIAHINRGDSIGYNMGHIAQKPLTIATVPLGHADGISRQYGKGVGFMYVNEQKAKIVGNVCMDMLMIDVSGIDCEIGDSVVVFNNKHSAEDLAHAAGTISYELITGITTRVKRVFKS